MYTQDIIITLGVISFAIVALSPFIINKIIKFKLELEKMRLEADVRKEEIRAKNQLEMDKLMMSEQSKEIKQEGGNIPRGRQIIHTDDSGRHEEDPMRERLRY